MSRLAPILSLVILVGTTSLMACSTAQPSTSAGTEPSETHSTQSAKAQSAEESNDSRLVRIVIDSEAIWLGDEKIVALVDGEVPGDQKVGGETGMHIKPLVGRLDEVYHDLKKRGLIEGAPKGRTIEIRTAPLTSYRLVTEVMYSAGQSGFHRSWVGVEQADGSSTRIDIHAPKLSELSNKDRYVITLGIVQEGFVMGAGSRRLMPVKECAETGPTICLLEGNDNVQSIIEEARIANLQGNAEKARQLTAKAVNAYDYRRLYNTLAELKKKHPEETMVTFGAQGDIPMAVVAQTTRVVRHQLPQDRYEDLATFRDVVDGFEGNDALFPQIVFTITQ